MLVAMQHLQVQFAERSMARIKRLKETGVTPCARETDFYQISAQRLVI